MENNIGDPLVLPSGPITQSRAKRYGAAMYSYVQDQVSQELKTKHLTSIVRNLKAHLGFLYCWRQVLKEWHAHAEWHAQAVLESDSWRLVKCGEARPCRVARPGHARA
ncbi:hypothetical protein JCGZ_02746 [Jatropha curcas]|uniref:Uncharacterized protein n=1 Tax=Jatropha curcas TaxID=180498 RepID=A0A067KU66_JATCU|nr:hypothetical protein JCGZ_02745 [Jatropha curcas]KDP39726.1 hypothetical protein JCGZ_02746 [Jatropha curcas]